MADIENLDVPADVKQRAPRYRRLNTGWDIREYGEDVQGGAVIPVMAGAIGAVAGLGLEAASKVLTGQNSRTGLKMAVGGAALARFGYGRFKRGCDAYEDGLKIAGAELKTSETA